MAGDIEEVDVGHGHGGIAAGDFGEGAGWNRKVVVSILAGWDQEELTEMSW